MAQTQTDRIAEMLVRAGHRGVCGTEFPAARFGARLFELRRDGWVITRRKCDRHTHPESVQFIYEVVDR